MLKETSLEIELPDGTVLEAPDDADPAAVARAYLAKQQPKKPKFGAEVMSAVARPVLNAVTGLPTLPLDAGYGLMEFLKQGRMPTLNDFNPFAERSTRLPGDIVREAIDRNTVAPGTTAGKVGELASTMLLGARLPGNLPRPTPQQAVAANAEAAARARVGVDVGSGRAGASASLQATPEATARGGGYTFGHAGDDVSAGLNEAQREAMRQGRSIGMRMTPGQATGSRALQQLEAKLESQPMTSGPFNALKAHNASTVNRASAQSIGERANVVDSTTLDRAFSRLGDVFDDAKDDVPRAIDARQFMERYSTLQDEARGLFTGFEQHPLVTDFVKLAEKGQATGKQIHSLASKLGKAAYKQMTTQSGDRDLGQTLYQLKDYADELLQQGMSPQRATRFANARTQYRNLMMLTGRTGIVNPSSGDVSGRTLANTLQRSDKRGFLRGQNETPMYRAARFSQAFPPIVGDSGTATRMPLQGVFDLATRIPANIATRAYLSSPSVRAISAADAGARATASTVRDAVALPEVGMNPYLLPALYPGLFSE
jgi:hypothetical protein